MSEDKPRLNRYSGDIRFSACLNYGLENYPYIRGYKEAAEALVKTLEDNNGRSVDGLVYPICYMYRHYLEILLKDILQTCGFLYDLEKIENFLSKPSHSLLRVWNKLHEVLKISGEYDVVIQNELKQFDDFIVELHELDDRGVSFRYFRDLNGDVQLRDRTTKEGIKHLDILSVHNGMQELSKFLECLDIDLSAKLEYVRETQAIQY